MSVVVTGQRSRTRINLPHPGRRPLRALLVSRLRGWKSGGRFLLVLCRGDKELLAAITVNRMNRQLNGGE